MTIAPKCCFFDVFGTCVDWRTTVTNELHGSAKEALNASKSSIDGKIKDAAAAMTAEHWDDIAVEWRLGYLKFVHDIASDPNIAFKTVDEHHLESLHKILTRRGLILAGEDSTPKDGSLWDEAKLQELNLVWHRLAPWPDTCKGLSELNRQVKTCTLSNGNLSLIQDMVDNGKMPFTDVYSAEMFQSYKPNPKVYLGAAKKMGLKPEECALVAAHLDDLKAAKACGFKTIYVVRPRGEERHPELNGEGIEDIRVDEHEEGFVEAARKLGIPVGS